MKVLVANLGSTSFKFKLFEFAVEEDNEIVIAQGAADRIGQGRSAWSVSVGAQHDEGTTDLADHGAAIDLHLERLLELGAISGLDELSAIGFKAVHGGPISGAVKVDESVLEIMDQFADIAPQHNPPYIAAMRAFGQRLPDVPQVAAFETGFHQTIPPARQLYGVPHEWVEQLGVRRYGFHGASHSYIATRMAQLAPEAKKIISCHLGGSCSISAMQNGESVSNSFGMTTQGGVFHASRVGDFDTFALLKLLQSGLELDAIFQKLGKEGGLKGLSGVSADMREVEEAAASGNERAQLAVDAFVETCRHYIGAQLVVLNGTDVLVFTGGIGQHGSAIRASICAKMDFVGIAVDEIKNGSVSGEDESRIDAGSVAIWVLPTNEELIVARQTAEVLAKQPA